MMVASSGYPSLTPACPLLRAAKLPGHHTFTGIEVRKMQGNILETTLFMAHGAV